MKRSKIFVLITAAVLALSLTACSTVTVVIPYEAVSGFFVNGENNEASDTAASDTTAAPETPVTEQEGYPADDTTAEHASADVTAEPAADTTSAPPVDTTAAPAADVTAAPASSAPSTKDEIIAYYVAAYNKIASDASSVTRTYDYTSNYNDILEINNNSTLESIAATLMNRFMVENKESVSGSASDLPPVGITNLSISPSQIGSASITDNGSYYEVTLTSTGTDSNYEVDVQPGSGSAGVIGPLLRTEDVSGAAGSLIKFEGLHSWYATAKVVARIDKASGHITDFNFTTPCILHFDSVTAAIVVKVSNCNLGLLFQQTWKIAY